MLRRAGLGALALVTAFGCNFAGGGGGDTDDVDAGDETPRFSTGHQFRKSITIEPATETELSGFMLAVFVSADDELAAGALADASDLMLTEAGSTEPLPIEIESYDAETGALALWVLRNPLRAETLHLYYGLEEAAPREAFLWPSDFRGVWHGRLSGDIAIDSSRSGLDAEKTDAGVLPAVASGAVGGGFDMVGTSAQFETTGSAIVFPTESFTYSAWVKVTDTGGPGDQPWHFGGSDRNVPGYDMELGSGAWRASVAGGGELNQADFGTLDEFVGQWTHVVAVVDRSSNELIAYANGIERDRAVIDPNANLAPSTAMLAHLGGDQSPFIGILDEVRVNASVLGQLRLEEQYANVTDADYIRVGSEETP